MRTKLTLRLEQTLIEQAKHYAKEHNQSLSQLTAHYFQVLVSESDKTDVMPPITQSLIGVLKTDVNPEDYKRHLEEKYL